MRLAHATWRLIGRDLLRAFCSAESSLHVPVFGTRFPGFVAAQPDARSRTLVPCACRLGSDVDLVGARLVADPVIWDLHHTSACRHCRSDRRTMSAPGPLWTLRLVRAPSVLDARHCSMVLRPRWPGPFFAHALRWRAHTPCEIHVAAPHTPPHSRGVALAVLRSARLSGDARSRVRCSRSSVAVRHEPARGLMLTTDFSRASGAREASVVTHG